MVWMWLVWPLMMLGVVALIVFLARGSASSRRAHGRRGDGTRSHAEVILDERWARGEITDEEYRQRLEQLHGASGA